MSMQINPIMDPELTPPLVYLRGEFALWHYKIPYFSSVVPLSFAVDKFSLIDEIPDSERIEWSLAELFQRDISWERVTQELVKYLRAEARPQFFNALTVALLPKHGHGFSAEYVERRQYAPITDSTLDTPVQVGGLQVQPYKGSGGGAGKLRWDRAEIIGVAVDGQHRLAALKELAGSVRPEKMDASSVPVIFIVPDPRLGYVEPPQPQERSQLVSSLRRIFIDLNKNARTVSRTRTILLDDQDIASVCCRLLIGERLTDKPEQDRIPLALVDWVSEASTKIETGPFLTTVLLLYEFVDLALGTRSTSDLEDEEDAKVREWLVRTFGPDENQLEDLMLQVKRCFNQDVPLTFMPAEIEILAGLFKRRWRQNMERVVHELKPYRALWKHAQDNGLLRPEFVNLYVAEELLEGQHGRERAQAIESAIQANDPDWNRERRFVRPLRYIDEEIKKDHWAFKVVFQRALFGCYLDLLQQAELFVENPEPNDEVVRQEFTTRWIMAVNALFDSDLALTTGSFSRPKEKFWAGIGLNADNTIDYTKAGANRIRGWLNAWVCLHEIGDESLDLKRLEEDERPLANIAWNALRKRPIEQGMTKLALARNENASDETITEEAQSYLAKRAKHLAKLSCATQPVS